MESQLRSALKHTISIDFSIYNLQEPTSKFANQASAHPSFSGYTSLHSLHRSASARSALKHTISIDFSIFNLQEADTGRQQECPQCRPCILLCWLEKSESAQSAFFRGFSLGSGAFSFSCILCILCILILLYIYIKIYI
jgi:hypothetical protein